MFTFLDEARSMQLKQKDKYHWFIFFGYHVISSNTKCKYPGSKVRGLATGCAVAGVERVAQTEERVIDII